jgi:hypothetical protein
LTTWISTSAGWPSNFKRDREAETVAKTSGLGAAILVADASSDVQTISDDVTEFSMATPRAVQDTTGVDVYAHQRLLLLADASVSLKGVFNAAANESHAVFSSVPSTSVVRATTITPTASEYPFLAFNAYYSSYDVTRSATGELTWASEGALADGSVPTWTNSA